MRLFPFPQESLKLAKDLNPHANHLFAAFQMLIRVWAHPRAIDFSRYSTPLDPEQDLDSPDASGKMAVVLTLLETLVATEKVVIFSQSLNALGAIEFFIKRRPEFESTYVRYDGSMSTTARTYVLGRFNTDPSTRYADDTTTRRSKHCLTGFLLVSVHRILLMSIKAGSTGISIVGASRAILFDLPWNPTTDAQSVGRIYRPGQEKTCYVYRLVTSVSVCAHPRPHGPTRLLMCLCVFFICTVGRDGNAHVSAARRQARTFVSHHR